MKRAVILCSGIIDINIDISKALVICADGGYSEAEKLGIVPDIIIGDCDSVDKPYPRGIQHIIYPSEKDKTDTELCIDYAIENGCAEIVLFGATGGRLDHEFANYNLLVYGLKKGVKIKIVDAFNEIWAENKPFSLKRNEKKYISFFPFGGSVDGFCIRGLKYTAENLTLECNSSLTCGNEFTDDDAYISFKRGVLLVMRCNDAKQKTASK